MRQSRTLNSSLLIAMTLALTTACSDSNDSFSPAPPDVPEPAAVPFQELYDQGVDRYLGVYTPMSSEADGDIVNHAFGGGDGPLCLTGGNYNMATLDGDAEELVIFLQGGGACWSDLCAANPVAESGILPFGILDRTLPGNPVATWDTAYLPYCDGSIFSGDVDVDSDGDGQVDRYQRGLKNLSASLDVIRNTFPAPTRILLTGNSAGGFGTDYALPLLRKLYPDTRIDLINDSGVGISKPGLTEQLSSEWNSGAFIPASCETCIGEDGHLTDYHKWQLEQDETLRAGYISTKQDFVIADVFVQIGGPAFEAQLIPELQELEAAHPDRVRSLIANGNEHTFLQSRYEQAVGSTTVMQWVADMLNDSDNWQSDSD